MNFGSVAFVPQEFEVVIDARHGEATPVATSAVVSGGRSGKITVRSSIAEQLLVQYPNSVNLSETIAVNSVQTYSQYNSQIVDLEANIPFDIHIGGKLILYGDEQNGNYNGNLTVELTFTVGD